MVQLPYDSYIPGDVVALTCIEGFIQSGAESITCNEDGKFEDVDTICTPGYNLLSIYFRLK